jgi:malate dehydrogenase (oxaloacetate-decarboxylating)(NADP+)
VPGNSNPPETGKAGSPVGNERDDAPVVVADRREIDARRIHFAVRRQPQTYKCYRRRIMALFTPQEALDYHSKIRRGKVEVMPVKPCRNQKDLSMAYSPGVAEACKAIHADRELAYTYTGKGNLVAVVSNGTAVLGLGDIGPDAGKPVMEGKGVLFKVFADVDCYDINLDVTDPDRLCDIVEAMEPTFGGINLEDIKAPECFYIEDRLKKEMNIPVFHDDQHGTAIISGAGLINALEISGKKMENIRLVISGAGAAGIA